MAPLKGFMEEVIPYVLTPRVMMIKGKDGPAVQNIMAVDIHPEYELVECAMSEDGILNLMISDGENKLTFEENFGPIDKLVIREEFPHYDEEAQVEGPMTIFQESHYDATNMDEPTEVHLVILLDEEFMLEKQDFEGGVLSLQLSDGEIYKLDIGGEFPDSIEIISDNEEPLAEVVDSIPDTEAQLPEGEQAPEGE